MFAYLRVFYRLILFALLVVIGLLITLVLFPLVGWQSKRRIIKTWSHWLLRALGIRLVVDRAPPAANLQGLMVSNHSSWIDIFATNAVQAVPQPEDLLFGQEVVPACHDQVNILRQAICQSAQKLRRFFVL